MLRILFVIPYKEMEETVKQIFEEVLSVKDDEITYDICYAESGEMCIRDRHGICIAYSLFAINSIFFYLSPQSTGINIQSRSSIFPAIVMFFQDMLYMFFFISILFIHSTANLIYTGSMS